MISTVRYRVTRRGLHGEVYGDSGEGERLISSEPRDMRVGEIVEVDYDSAIDDRGEPVAWRTGVGGRQSVRISVEEREALERLNRELMLAVYRDDNNCLPHYRTCVAAITRLVSQE